MFLVTGHSQKYTTFAVLIDSDNVDDAARSACDAWNKKHNGSLQLVSDDNGDYLLEAGVVYDSRSDSLPRRGFELCVMSIKPGDVVNIL